MGGGQASVRLGCRRVRSDRREDAAALARLFSLLGRPASGGFVEWRWVGWPGAGNHAIVVEGMGSEAAWRGDRAQSRGAAAATACRPHHRARRRSGVVRFRSSGVEDGGGYPWRLRSMVGCRLRSAGVGRCR